MSEPAPSSKRRKSGRGWAAFFAAFAAYQAYFGYRAQIRGEMRYFKSGWYTPEAAYFVAFCSLALSIWLVVSVLRKPNDI